MTVLHCRAFPNDRLWLLPYFSIPEILVRIQTERRPGPRGFLVFFLGKFCSANRFFYLFLLAKRWEPRKESPWSWPLGSSLSCYQLLTIVSDWRIFLIVLRVIWLDGLNIFGEVTGKKKVTSLTAVKCWASMKVRFSTILTRGFLFSRLGASRRKLPNQKRW